MKRRKNGIFLIAAFSALIIVSAVILIFSEKTLFPEKLGDMELKLHSEGDVAMREILLEKRSCDLDSSWQSRQGLSIKDYF